ncbi:hypothetical protein GIB67_039547, partial [Kingdonia uniflora]
QIDSSLLNAFVSKVGVPNNVNNRNGAARLLKNARNRLRYHRLNTTKKLHLQYLIRRQLKRSSLINVMQRIVKQMPNKKLILDYIILKNQIFMLI